MEGAGGWWRRSGRGRRRAGKRGRGAEADDLVPAQCLQKWLETAADQAPQDGTVGLDLTDTGRPLDLPGRSGADETDLYSPDLWLLRHACHARNEGPGPASVELPIAHRAAPNEASGRALNPGGHAAV